MSIGEDGALSSAAAGAAAGTAVMPGWGTLIGAGLGLVGGWLGDKSSKRQEEIQREFAQSGIQWRVADAKAAGVHPLFALGASPASYSPVSSPLASSIGEMGQNVSRAALASQQQEIQEEQLALQRIAASASAERDFATASAQRALAAKTLQDMNVSQPVMPPARGVSLSQLRGAEGVDVLADPGPGLEGQAVSRARAAAPPVSPTGAIRYEADKVISASAADASVTAGVRPGWMRVVVGEVEGPEGREPIEIVLPQGSEVSDALEAISEGGGSGIRGMIYAENLRRYGSVYANALRERLRRGGSGSVGADLVAPVGDFFREWRRRKQANRPGR